MKKVFRIFAELFSCLALIAVLTACDSLNLPLAPNVGEPPHTHNYESTWTYNETHHWHESTCGCDVKADFEQHTLEDSGCCSVCEQAVLPTNGIYYEISADGTYAEVVAYLGTSTKVNIASTYNGVPVTSIYSNAFENAAITTVVIPNSVTSIGYEAFRDCKSLTSINIPDSVTSIGNYAFYNCKSLTSINIPDSVTSIGYDAFYNCPITKATIPTLAISYIRNSNLKEVVITSGENIPDSAFYNCSSLTSIVIPDSVTSIGSSAFYGCTSLVYNTYGTIKYLGNENKPYLVAISTVNTNFTSYELHEQTKILAGTFKNCTRLTSITIPDTVTSIAGSFYGCSSLTSIVIPDSVTSIGYRAFYNCSSLTSIVIPDSVTSIGEDAFYNCSSLTSIEIPDSVTSIGYEAFSGCSSLTEITLPFVGATKDGTRNTRFGYIFGALQDGNDYDYSYYVPSSLKTVIITGGTSIGDEAFYNCSGLTSITIPDSVTSIESRAFRGCSSLTSIVVPDSVTSIGYQAFAKTNLTSIVIPDSVTSIGYQAFGSCTNLTSIVIPDSVTSIGYQAFGNCTNLTSIVIPDSVTSIGEGAFQYCSSLTSIVISDSVTSIGDYAFYNCSSLTSVVIPDSVTSIGEGAFRYCSSLTSITIPDSVTSIGERAFYNCSSLTSVYYQGTESDWAQISISSYNTNLTNATRYYYSETEPTTTGNYWHYDENGNVVVW